MLASSASSKRTGSVQQGLTNCSGFQGNCHRLPILLSNPGLNKGISIITPLATYFFIAIAFLQANVWRGRGTLTSQQHTTELWRICWWRRVWKRLMRQETCPLLRCRKRYVNQYFGNSVIKFELSCYVRNTLYMDEKKKWKTSLPELFFEIDKRLKSVFYSSKRKPVYG